MEQTEAYQNMREVVLDTETTGLDPAAGHRIVEIGCVELLNHVASGKTYQCYIDPQRDMPAEAFAVHGLSSEFLAGKPVFAAIADDFLDFVGDSPLVIHNAGFDLKFINAELSAYHREPVDPARAIDTVQLARKKYPGAPANLDALCRRFDIDLSTRTKHGALLDAELLAEVYLELVGGRQPGLTLAVASTATARVLEQRQFKEPRPHSPNAAEQARHETFIENEVTEPIWRQ